MIEAAVLLALGYFLAKEAVTSFVLATDLIKWTKLRRKGRRMSFRAFVEDNTRGTWG